MEACSAVDCSVCVYLVRCLLNFYVVVAPLASKLLCLAKLWLKDVEKRSFLKAAEQDG